MNRQKLVNALEIVKPGLSNKEMIEQSTCFAFEKGRVITYNDEISISHPVEDLDIEGAIDADSLYKLLTKIKSEELEISLQNENELLIRSGKSRAGITLQNEVKLPLEEIGKIDKWQKMPENLILAMKFCSFSCSKDMSQPKLTCVHVAESGYVEGCESYRLTRYKLDKKSKFSFLIPASSVQELIKYDFSEFCMTNGWVHFKTDDGTVFSCRTFDDIYPDLEEKGLFNVTGVDIKLPSRLSEVLDKAAVFSRREYILDEEVLIDLTKNKIKIRGQSDNGWYEEEARIRYIGDDVSFAINPSFLQDMLSILQTCTLGEDRIKFTGDKWEHVIALR